jgi:predicted secreted Zn-dependent protease
MGIRAIPQSLQVNKVKVTVKVKFTLEQNTKAQRGSRSIALLFFNLGTKWGWVGPGLA